MALTQQSLQQVVCHVRTHVGYSAAPQLGLIHVTGHDAATYLQSQTSNDALQLAVGQGQLSALLDRKAQIQAVFSLHRAEDGFWLLLDGVQIPHTLAHLEQFHFTEDVVFTDRSGEFTLFLVQGPNSFRLFQPHNENLTATMPNYDLFALPELIKPPGFVIKRSFTGEEGFCLCVPQSQAAQLEALLAEQQTALKMAAMSPDVLNTLRVEAGIPQFGVDMDRRTMLPSTGLEGSCVSYTKGCFPGQEVVAKVKTYGSVGKALMGLLFEPGTQIPAVDSLIEVDSQGIGTLKSAVNSPTLERPIAMAYLNREHRVPHKTLMVEIAGETYKVMVEFLPFYTPVVAEEKARQRLEEGLAHFAGDDEDKAIELLREAITLDPHLSDAYEALGVILSRREEYDEAIALMQKLSDIDPDAVMAHTNLSVFYMKKGMIEAAEEEKAKATTLQFKQAIAARQQQQNDEADRRRKEETLLQKIGMFQEVLALDPEDVLAHYGLGNTLSELGRHEEAIPLLEKAIVLDPKYTVAYLALGKAQECAGKPEAARQTFEAGIAVAAQRGDLMPLQDMQNRLSNLQN